MDFVSAFPRTKAGNDTIWMVVDHLTKSATLIPIQSTWSIDMFAKEYVKWVVKCHGVLKYIVSELDS